MSYKNKQKNSTHEKSNKSYSSSWLKHVSALAMPTVLSAGVLVACGQMSNAESSATSSTKSGTQNSGVTSSRDMLPSDMLKQMQALPQLTSGLGDTGAGK